MSISRRFLISLVMSPAWWLGVAISLLLHLLVVQVVDDKAKSQFDYLADNAQTAVQNRVRSYIDVLRGTAALFHTNDKITREQFRAYVRELNSTAVFPVSPISILDSTSPGRTSRRLKHRYAAIPAFHR